MKSPGSTSGIKRVGVICGLLWLVVVIDDAAVTGFHVGQEVTTSADKRSAAIKKESGPSARRIQFILEESNAEIGTEPPRTSRRHTKYAKGPGAAVQVASLLASAAIAATALPSATFAVSGGGLDYANLDITGQDFSKGNYKGKDFTQVIAKTTNFAGSNLQGCRFYKAYLVKANFEGSDLRGASLEDTSMDGANLKNAIASGAYFSASVLDAESLENADFSDAQFPLKTIPLLCDRPDLKGTNPSTGVDTRESAMCP